ncbi:hypothetical protein [Ferruginibacter albus]|uniref:hypothetical protein n=1 Tax=Ferruginibacter albus TaxID=2875540 RepID=UPI001CC589B4|nr:hypothetical protein [Ferruginibacter albus]UAY53444.1 hypothetical protein K9M53_07160 [Ferruginibacter albus]
MNTLKLILIGLLMLLGFHGNAQNKNNMTNITNITADAVNDKVYINWSTDGEMPTNYFKVQCSDDGEYFKTVAFVLGHNARPAGDNYKYEIKSGSINTLYYRIKYVAADGNEEVSKIIQL